MSTLLRRATTVSNHQKVGCTQIENFWCEASSSTRNKALATWNVLARTIAAIHDRLNGQKRNTILGLIRDPKNSDRRTSSITAAGRQEIPWQIKFCPLIIIEEVGEHVKTSACIGPVNDRYRKPWTIVRTVSNELFWYDYEVAGSVFKYTRGLQVQMKPESPSSSFWFP